MGYENISANNGISIAATGMIIVFFALTLISLFIYVLPILLKHLSPLLPATPSPAPESETAETDALVAAIGFTLHQIRKNRGT